MLILSGKCWNYIYEFNEIVLDLCFKCNQFVILVIKVVFGAAYVVLVRYGDSANAKHFQNQLHGEEQNEDLKENVAKYPSMLITS